MEDQKRLPENALSAMTTTEGLKVELFAAEPMVTNPTNISIDEKGRVWVCEAYNYDVSPEMVDKQGDRILVLEDTDHDGKADKRTVFYQGTDITTPLGIMASGNKVYVTRSPNILILSDENGDLIADTRDTLFTNLGTKGDHSAHALFPGPDGNLYFSTGNYAGAIQDKNGNPVVDKAGFTVDQTGQPYLGGMVMRFAPGGKAFEVLGHNFRNNYEPCIDSYGNIWQSDNDDDGNASCRINFVMPYGNYGYLDEITRASWKTNRVNVEEKIVERHWHQSDPGVVPNVLITGAGSPAGMTIYEGTLLPRDFNGMPIHAEPYYNVVRSYITTKAGAGYSSTVKEILKSEDQWFRPVDVCTAPDGSLFVADWYDPILGGGAAGDAAQGRIYRIAPDVHRYKVPAYDLSTAIGAIEGLKSPNLETRYLAFQQLKLDGEAGVEALKKLWSSENSAFRARAFWLLVTMDRNGSFLKEALKDDDPAIRTAAVKAVLQTQPNVASYLTIVAKDVDPSVRREAATSLRYDHTPEGAKVWSELAAQYDGSDRWYLEALGIGSDLHADLYFKTWKESTTIDLKKRAHQDILWRLRASEVLALLADLIKQSPDTKSTLRYFRAFHFHRHPDKNKILSTLLDLPGENKNEISALALQQMEVSNFQMTPLVQAALKNALQETKGTIGFVDLISKFKLKDYHRELVALVVGQPSNEVATAALDLLIEFQAFDVIRNVLVKNDASTLALLKTVKGKGNSTIVSLLADVVQNKTASMAIRQNSVLTLGSSWTGENKLLELVKDKGFEEKLKPVAASVLFNVYRRSVQVEAARFLSKPVAAGKELPSIKQLVASSGDIQNGSVVFNKYCTTCHRVQTLGNKFGPELTQIGDKLSKDGLYHAIIFPDEGISNGYETTMLSLKDGGEAMGIIANETDAEIELSQPGGTSSRFPRSDVTGNEKREFSLMPALASSMSEQELIDLVSYLGSLKK